MQAARKVRTLLPSVKIIFVTQQVDLRYLQAAFQVGANGFVAKQSASSELLNATERVLKGQTFVTPLLADAYAELNPARKGDTAAYTEDPLTVRQSEVLQLVAEGTP